MMKEKTVLRILSCALACTMLFETPLQAAAATDGVNLQTDEDDVPAEDGGTDGQDVPADDSETGGQDMPNTDGMGSDGQTLPEKEKEETGTGTDNSGQGNENNGVSTDGEDVLDAVTGEDDPSDAPGEEDGEAQQDIPVDTSAPNISNSLPTAGTDNGMPLQ